MSEPFVVDRYLVCDEIGSGGMARVHLGRVLGAGGFSRVVAIKRLIGDGPDPEGAAMLIDEARLASRIRHPNVVPALDVVRSVEHLLFVMEYVHGASLSWLLRRLQTKNERVPMPIATRIVLDVLAGLHAAHEARSERGRPLEIIHRDVSPHNVLVGDDGIARVADFGIARAKGKLIQTEAGVIRGKLLYMAPEQLCGHELDRRVDVYAAGLVLWELLTMKRLRSGPSAGTPITDVIESFVASKPEPPSRLNDDCSPSLDEVVMRALAASQHERWSTAQQMADSLEHAAPVATTKDVAAWLRNVASDLLAKHAKLLGEIEVVSAAYDVGPTKTVGTAANGPASETALAPITPRSDAATMQYAPTIVHVPIVESEQPSDRARKDSTDRSSREPTTRKSLVAVALVATIVSVAALGAVAIVASAGGARAPAHSTVSAPGSASVPVAIPPAPTSAASAAAPLTVAGASSPAAHAVPAASATTTSPAKPKPAGPARRECDPPYTIDAQGVRIPKRECFGQK